jgi:hypothetical protein
MAESEILMRCLCVFAFSVLFFALPAFAQDDGPASFGGGMTVDESPMQLQQMADPIKQIKETLAKAKISLSRDQERALQPAIDETIKAMQELTAGGPAAGNRGQGFARGGRGGFRGQMAGRGGAEVLAQSPRMRELNDQFEAKMKAILKPDQAAAWDAYRKDQIKKAGGLEALKIILADANAPLTPEQEQQIAPLYMELTRARMRLTIEGQGTPEPAKLKVLESDNAVQVAKFLNAAQKKALVESMRK